ncbi:hypothetical protein R1sor_007496 [Riccia sorocarpa]|uniref:Cytochrome b561 domain-containing protein n=1 Tax=Riccia sorocarpa TaxID=122646 RepID=A0ABD3HUU4_9MARC
METLLRGAIRTSFPSAALVSTGTKFSEEPARCKMLVTRAHVAAGSHSRVEESRTENVRLTNSASKRSAESVALPSKEDSSSFDGESIMFSVSPLPILALASLPGGILNLNLIYVGAVVLLAMGGYGTYLGWQIRLSDDLDLKAEAKNLHPKLFAGLFFFFAAGATGGVTSLLTQGKSILESNHALTGIIGLALLAAQTTLSTQFEGKPELRSIHAYLGSGIMALFVVHAALGLQLGLSL